MAITHEVANALVAEIATLAGNVAGKVSSARRSSHTGVVDHVDRDGVAWVTLPGSTEAVPASVRDVEVRPGQQVTVTFEGHALLITGNQGDPAMGESGVEATIKPRLTRIGEETSKAKQAADAAAKVAKAIRQHFWHDGAGAHISSKAGDAEGAQNALWNSLGMLFRAGADNLLAIVTGSDPGVDVYDGQGNASSNIIAAFHGSGARIGPEDGAHVSVDSDSVDVYDADGGRATTIGKVRRVGQERVGLIVGDSGDGWGDASLLSAHGEWTDDESGTAHYSKTTELESSEWGLEATTGDYLGCDLNVRATATDQDAMMAQASLELDAYGDVGDHGSSYAGLVVASEHAPQGRSGIWVNSDDTSDVAGVDLNGNTFYFSDPREDGRYGTRNQSAAVSVSNNAEKSIIEVDLEPGTYLLTGHAVFASNATGRRSAGFSPTKDSLTTSYTATVVTVPAADGQVTQIMVPLIYSPQADTTLYFTVRQTSGAARNVTGQVRWVRLL